MAINKTCYRNYRKPIIHESKLFNVVLAIIKIILTMTNLIFNNNSHSHKLYITLQVKMFN